MTAITSSHKSRFFIVAFAATVLALPDGSARGDVTLSLGAAVGSPGSEALLGVFATSDSSDVISGFNLPLDVGIDGNTLPNGVALTSSPIRNAVYATTALKTSFNSALGIDGLVNGDGTNIVLSTTPLLLFDIAFAISAAAPTSSDVPVHIVNPTLPVNLFRVAGPNNPVVSLITAGSLQIDATETADFNADQLVQGIDFLIWQRGFGIATGATQGDGDANHDGAVNGLDLMIWKDQYATSTGAIRGYLRAVPEPSADAAAAFMVLLVMLGGGTTRRRFHQVGTDRGGADRRDFRGRRRTSSPRRRTPDS